MLAYRTWEKMILLRSIGLNYHHLVLVVNVWSGEQSGISCQCGWDQFTRSDNHTARPQKILKNSSHFGFAMRVVQVHAFLGCNSCLRLHLSPILRSAYSFSPPPPPGINHLTCSLSTYWNLESRYWWLIIELVSFLRRRSLLLKWHRSVLIEVGIELEHFIAARGEAV